MGGARELQGDTLVVRIPMRFKRQGGRKRVLGPDGSDLTPPARAQPDGKLVKALVRAWRWQRQLDAGVYVSSRHRCIVLILIVAPVAS